MKYENVKIGDEFILHTKYSQQIQKVTAVTPKRFTVCGYVFAKKDGSKIGGDIWSRIYISPCTEEARSIFLEKHYKKNLIKELERITYDKFTLKQLEKIKELFDSFDGNLK